MVNRFQGIREIIAGRRRRKRNTLRRNIRRMKWNPRRNRLKTKTLNWIMFHYKCQRVLLIFIFSFFIDVFLEGDLIGSPPPTDLKSAPRKTTMLWTTKTWFSLFNLSRHVSELESPRLGIGVATSRNRFPSPRQAVKSRHWKMHNTRRHTILWFCRKDKIE